MNMNMVQYYYYYYYYYLVIVLAAAVVSGVPELRVGYYSESCPAAESVVRGVMKKALVREPRSLASVMRFQFHDCFVQGCDGSMLLDDTPTMVGEKLSLSNINSLRSYEVIDEAKLALEELCPGVVSCADVIIMASRDAVGLAGGPSWEVRLGRLDSLWASQEAADAVMPSPRANASALLRLFASNNLTARDLVALSGSHSIGQGRCFSVMFRLYEQVDPVIDPGFKAELRRLCPESVDQNVTGGLDGTPEVFDNRYFRDLVAGRGFLNSDQTLYEWPETTEVVEEFSRDQEAFFSAFVDGMLRMGDFQSGKPGEVRANCRVVNRRTSRLRHHSLVRQS